MSSPHHQPRVVTQVTRSNFSTSTDKDFEKVDNKYLPNPLQGRVASLATVPSSASSGLSSFNSLTDEVTERPKANVKVSTFTPDFRFLTCQAYTGGEQLKMRLVTRHTQRGVHPPVFFLWQWQWQCVAHPSSLRPRTIVRRLDSKKKICVRCWLVRRTGTCVLIRCIVIQFRCEHRGDGIFTVRLRIEPQHHCI